MIVQHHCRILQNVKVYILEGWEMGKTQAELAFETADLTLFETIGNLAAWTTRRPPRSYYRITAERDAADGGLAGEAWRHFITSWRRAGGDRRRIKGV